MPMNKIADHEYVASVWFERDRANLSLSTPKGREIFSLWDDAVYEELESGYLTAPRMASIMRCSESDWQPHLVAYARERGLIT